MQHRKLSACWCFYHFIMKNAESGGVSLTAAVSLTSSYSGRHTEWEEVQYYCIDYFQLYFHLTLALDHLYRQSFRDLHYLSLSSAAVINLALYLSLSLLLWSLRGVNIWLHESHDAISTYEIQIVLTSIFLHKISFFTQYKLYFMITPRPNVCRRIIFA